MAAPIAQAGAEQKLERLDGRAQRAVRTRAAIVEATLTLLERGQLQPTAQEIAQRARVSIRAVFHHYGDMDRLLLATIQLHLSRHPFDALPQLLETGSLEERLVAFVNRRAASFERILPVHRAVLLKEGMDENVARRMKRARAGAKYEVRKAFAPELAQASDDTLSEALIAAAGWCNWEALRVRAGLPFARARAVLEYTLRSLLLARSEPHV